MSIDSDCPICGKYLNKDHRCSERVLRAIDAAHRKAEDDYFGIERTPSERERLKDGFKMMFDSYRDYEDVRDIGKDKEGGY